MNRYSNVWIPSGTKTKLSQIALDVCHLAGVGNPKFRPNLPVYSAR